MFIITSSLTLFLKEHFSYFFILKINIFFYFFKKEMPEIKKSVKSVDKPTTDAAKPKKRATKKPSTAKKTTAKKTAAKKTTKKK